MASSQTTTQFNVTRNTWVAKLQMPTARAGLAAAVMGDVLVAAGGQDELGAVVTTEVYHIAANTWETAPPLESARYNFCLLPYNGEYMLAFGGNAGGDPATLVEYIVPEGASAGWGAFPSLAMLYPVHNYFAVALQNDFFFAGGIQAGEAFTSKVQVLSSIFAHLAGQFANTSYRRCFAARGRA